MNYKLNDLFVIQRDMTVNLQTIVCAGTYGQVESLINPHFSMIRVKGELYTVANAKLESYTKLIDTSVPATRFSEVVAEDLTFDAAMKNLFRGSKVSRKVWGGYWKLGSIYTDGQYGAEYKKAIVAHLKDGGWSVATPYQDDMLATDWMVVR